MKKCPTCEKATLERKQAGKGMGDWWVCTNPDCSQYQQPRNLDPDD